MLVTLSGISMLVRLVQLEKALKAILVPPVIITVFNDEGTYDKAPNIYPKCVLLVPSFVAPTKGIVILSRLVQPSNASEPMLVTLSGIAMLVRLVQPENAEEPMLVTLSPIVMLARLVQP